MTDAERPAPYSAATKVLSVLQGFASHDGAMSLGALALQTGLPKTTVHRMVGFLRSAGFVVMVDNRFLLSSKVTDLSAAVPAGLTASMREILLPTLTELYELTREAAQLAVRCGNMVRVVERVHGRNSTGVASRFRTPLPLHCTAPGKVLLAGSKELTAAACAGGLEPHTAVTITTSERLCAELGNVRRYGVAFDRGEWCSGVTGVAAPIWGPGRVLMGAISVMGPADRLRADAVAPKVSKAAGNASKELQAAKIFFKQWIAS
ncbi:IclR family transcriptional regulator [Lentzea sp. E54]|uniref:IclR family transcriptional regulator n=1 Tax=Lentzea xerophila TaxID=3435883 RepID=UPI003DA59FE9